MDRYLVMADPDGGPRRSNITDFAKKFTQELDRFTVRSVSVNTPFSDSGTTWLGERQAAFVSARTRPSAFNAGRPGTMSLPGPFMWPM